MSRFRPSVFYVLVSAASAALVVVGTVDTWARVGAEAASSSVTGLHIDVGVIVLMSVTFGAALMAWRAVVPDGWSGVVGVAWAVWSALFAGTGLGAAVYALTSLRSAVGGGAVSADAKWGLYVSLAAAIVLLLEVVSVLRRYRPRAAPVPAASRRLPLDALIGISALYLVAIGPRIFDGYTVNSILTYTFWAGTAAAGLIFLSSYGGMVSLAQVPIYGIAGFVLGNVVAIGGNGGGGLNLGWNPWIGVVLGIAMATAIGLLFGALASRSTGIYFLMITLTYAVIANLFFGQVADLSGFNGITSIQQRIPGVIGSPDVHPDRLYYVALVAAPTLSAWTKYHVRPPIGLTLQGIRADPVRMASLGYNVPLHKTLAFGLAGFIAAVAGIINVWWIGEIAPSSIDLNAVLGLLIIAVIGGLYRLEGAWLGAFAYVMINNYTHTLSVPAIGGGFNTVIGLIFLAIVLVSPGGLFGLWDWAVGGGLSGAVGHARRAISGRRALPGVETGGGEK
jgi:branched-chain amino acid transport system permease protein